MKQRPRRLQFTQPAKQKPRQSKILKLQLRQKLEICPSKTTLCLDLPCEQETELAARTDGTIVLRTKTSKRVIWSFASGSPIYTSYQAPPTLDNGNEAASRPTPSFFIDCGDDWELYAHVTRSNKMVCARNSVTVEEFVKHMPYVSEEQKGQSQLARRGRLCMW
ncbi:hypothetical protein V6N13_111710 [Hibiscus sabdariffa]